MKAIFSFASLLIVLAIVAVTVRNELRAEKKFLPGATSAADAASASSAPFGGSSAPNVAEFQRELDKTMKGAADRAASAGDAADTPR